MEKVLDKLREATENSRYYGRLFLVGGIVRDEFFGVPSDEDIDIVLEGDAAELANFLYENGITTHRPVTYARFGTAMVIIDGRTVELVGARKESYDTSSRKPYTVPGTLADDVARRDFTINTLLENLHTGEILDLTGQGKQDINDRIIRTPVDPVVTFTDDPLRMLRAIRFSCRLGFKIEDNTYTAIYSCSHRLSIVSHERIHDEFVKILLSPSPATGLEMLLKTGLLTEFAPELAAMQYSAWKQSLQILESILAESGIILRLAALLHNISATPAEAAEIAHHLLKRLKFSNSEMVRIEFLISMLPRIKEYDYQWTDADVRRIIRDAGDRLDDLVLLAKVDSTSNNVDGFVRHTERVKSSLAGKPLTSPLSGKEIIDLLGIDSGPRVGEVKAYLEQQIIEGYIQPGDKKEAEKSVLTKFRTK